MQTGNLPTGLPEDHGYQTVGWYVLAWCSKWLLQPDGPDAGDPFRFTNEQARFVLWWYAVDDRGRWVYRRGVLRRMKGWGKGPVAAALALVELLGPCRFAGWRKDGRPKAAKHPKPWVQLAAFSRDQTANTFDLVRAMLGERKEIDGIVVDSGKSRILAGPIGERKLEPVTASSESLEGGRPTFVILDEPHHMTASNGGHKLARVCRRNLGKSRDGTGRMLATTNAHCPGENSVAEIDYEAFLAMKEGRTRRTSLLYDCIEAPPVPDLTDEDALWAALEIARGDAVWLDIETLLIEIYDPANPVEESLRFYLNQLAASADAWLTPQDVDRAVVDDEIVKDTLVALGFDGSRNDDSTALIAIRISDGLAQVVKVWEKPEGPGHDDWEVPREEVADTVAWANAFWDVCAFFSDRYPWDSYVDQWAEEYRDALFVKAGTNHKVAFDMRSRLSDFTKAAESTEGAFKEGTIKLANTGQIETLKRHFKNARRRPNKYGVGFGKESRESSRKVDAAAAFVLAREARRVAIQAGVLEKRRKRRGPGRVIGW